MPKPVRKLPRLSLNRWGRNADSDLDVAYRTKMGIALIGKSEEVLGTPAAKKLAGRVNLVFTSPPFPLLLKKSYGNKQGRAYVDWLASFGTLLRDLLTPDGSIVVEIGNSWEAGQPTMSTLAIEALLALKKKADLHLCQEFIWHNPAKLPTPAEWVTIRRVRVKDSFTRLWWLSTTPNPKADNRRVLQPYGASMRKLLETGKYNAGRRPSGHVIGRKSFLTNNGGSIPPNVVTIDQEDSKSPSSVISGANTSSNSVYRKYCEKHNLEPHPARMPEDLAAFFIRLTTEERDLVLDPFGGSNTTGAAAERLARQWVTIEASAGYAASGYSRFEPESDRKKKRRG